MIQPNLFPAASSVEQQLFSIAAGLDRRLAQVEATGGSISAVSGTVIISGSIPGTAITSGTITATQIVAGGITTAALAAGSVTAAIIAAGVINASHIQANTITANELAANSVTASEIAANVITATHIQSGSLTTTTIAAGAITTALLAAGAVTSDKITVTALSAITSNVGSITSGTIQGATIQTASSGSRVVIDSLGIRGYALNGTTKVFEVATGTGIASFTGVANIDASSVIPGGAVTTGTLPGDRIVTGSIATLQIAAGAITANTIAAGAVTAQKLSVAFGGANMLQNSQFAYYTGVATETVTAARNLITNPSIEAVTTGWFNADTPAFFLAAGATLTQDFTQALYGSASLKVVTPATVSNGAGTNVLGTYTLSQPYTASLWIRGNAGGETVSLFFGSQTGTTNYATSGTVTLTTSWQRVTLTWTPNVTVSNAVFIVRTTTATARTFFIDGVMAVVGSTTPAFFDGSTDPLASWDGTVNLSTSSLSSIVGDPGVVNGRLINRVDNPSAEVDTAGWSSTAGGIVPGAALTRVTTQSTKGSASIQAVTPATTGTGVSHAMGVLPAGTYAWALDVRCNTAATGLQVYVGPFSGTGGSTTAITAGVTFTRFSGTFTADGTSNQVIAVKVASAIARTFQVDAVTVTLGGGVPDYFDGSTAGGSWVGVAHESMSWIPDSPGYWQHYDNGGTGGATWFKNPSGGPTGENSWKVAYSGTSAAKGWAASATYPAKAATSYVLSFYYRGSGAVPVVASNHSFDLDNTWLAQPTPSSTTWQRYAVRLKSTAGGTGSLDNVYIYPPIGTGVGEIADVQYEEGETLSAYAPFTSELLPYSVGNTTLSPNAITTDKILAGTIQGDDIAASTITASNMNVTTLSAITGDMGTLTSGSISVPSTVGARLVLDAAGFRQYASDGVTIQVNIPSSGASAEFAGHINSDGIDFLSDTVFTFPSNPQYGVSWHDTTFGGTKLGFITNTAFTNTATTIVQGIAKSSLLVGAAQLHGSNFAGTLSTSFTVSQGASTSSITFLTANTPGTLITSANESQFLRFVTVGVGGGPTVRNAWVEYGQSSVGPNTSVTLSINIITLVSAQVTIRALGFTAVQPLNYDQPFSNTIRIFNNNAITLSFDWMAIGTGPT